MQKSLLNAEKTDGDGWKDGRTDGQMDGRPDRWTEGWTERADGETEKRNN